MTNIPQAAVAPPANPVSGHASMADCYKIGWSRFSSAAWTASGGIGVAVGVQGRIAWVAWVVIVSGVLMLISGLLSFRSSAVVIDSSSVKEKNLYQRVRRRHPIDGWSDLFFMFNKLYRRSDGQKVADLSKWYVNGAEAQRFRADLAAYQAQSAA